jgi:phage terminase small subunit
MVVKRLVEIGFGDLRRCFDGQRLLEPGEWPDDVAPMIAGFEVVVKPVGDGEVEHVAKIKTRDTVRALELLGKHTGAFEQDNRQKVPPVPLTEAEQKL